ncbi:MAG: carbohydrate ABC transporter substrate-binding protein, partial [Chloroflexi bacterium]|nr:carbohydrate ABC transporter substrate-binding protein [Chloroflexota bacterium]
MRGFSRREFLRWSALGSATLALAACAPPAAPPPAPAEKEVEKPAEKVAPAAAKVKIRYQSRSGGGALGETLWREFFAYFYDKNPNVEVEWLVAPAGDLTENIMSQMVAGDAPDVYQLCCWDSTFFIQQGQALNLQPYIDRDAEEVNIDDFYARQFDPWKLGGDIHFMPYYTGTVAIYYNKRWFDELGVEYPPSKW